MNTSSRPSPKYAGFALAGALALGACIQGPWDYYPENPPVFRGIFVTAYALAGKPVQHVCFERVLDLAEEATQAYAFYDSADVRISGRFSGGPATLVLTAVSDTPNCFKGDAASLVEKGEDYDLTARISWDSAGKRVTSVLTATAQVPDSFSLHDSARAPGFAACGRPPENVLDTAFIASLPQEVRLVLIKEYGDTLGKILGDTAATREYLEANGAKLQARVAELLAVSSVTYPKGGTVFYLTGPFNTLSHYFSADRSPDVQGVLITQRFDSTSSRPETRFDNPFGPKPDSSEFYVPGYLRRLLIYPDAKGASGYNLLDSMGVVNVWFHTGVNRLYFYGFEQAYYAYTSTVLDNGGDPKIKPKYNVIGGRGIFVGGIPDSFDINVKADKQTTIYPLQQTHSLFCSKEGWGKSKDCRDYYQGYCASQDWEPGYCGEAALIACLVADSSASDSLKSCSPKKDSLREDAALALRAENQYCLERNFPADAGCDEARARCLETKGANECKQALWNYCLDRSWRPEQCGPGLASYCHDKPRLSEALCKEADKYCAAHPGSVLCK